MTRTRKDEIVLNSTNLDDPKHPFWLRREGGENHNVFSRAEICELLQVGDSSFGKWDIPGCGKSGKYSLYRLTDVMWLRLGDQFSRHNPHLSLNREQAAGMAREMMENMGPR